MWFTGSRTDTRIVYLFRYGCGIERSDPRVPRQHTRCRRSSETVIPALERRPRHRSLQQWPAERCPGRDNRGGSTTLVGTTVLVRAATRGWLSGSRVWHSDSVTSAVDVPRHRRLPPRRDSSPASSKTRHPGDDGPANRPRGTERSPATIGASSGNDEYAAEGEYDHTQGTEMIQYTATWDVIVPPIFGPLRPNQRSR